MLEEEIPNSDIWFEKENLLQQSYEDLKIPYTSSTTLSVTILRGRNIKVNFLHDLIDAPDAQVYLECRRALGQKFFKTKVAANTKSPVWNENFVFLLTDGELSGAKLQIAVYDDNTLWFDDYLGAEDIKVDELELGKLEERTLTYGKHGEIDVKLLKSKRDSPDFRLSFGLCENERIFRKKRKPRTMVALQKFLGDDEGPNTLDETPTIALAITGGGYRAVASCTGVVEALSESGLLDALMYVAGLSGSSWYIASSYARKAFGSLQSLTDHHDWLRKQMEPNLLISLESLSFWEKYAKHDIHKHASHQPTTLTDIYGMLLGETFLGDEHLTMRFSDVQGYVKTGDVPYPIITCTHVRRNLSMAKFFDDVSMTPFEFSIPAYGINLPSEEFNSLWRNGILQQKLPEPLLNYLLSTSGSAFGIIEGDFKYTTEIDPDFWKYIDSIEDHALPKQSGSTTTTTKDDSSESEEDDDDSAAESTPSNMKARIDKNFSSKNSRWLDEYLEAEKTKKKDKLKGDKPKSEGNRGTLLLRTSLVNNVALGIKDNTKYTFATENVDTAPADSLPLNVKRKITTKKRNICLVDTGIGTNLPNLHVLRPQREVDVIILICCTGYSGKDTLPLHVFAIAQKQAWDQGLKFPKIDIEKIAQNPFENLYVFEDEQDPECPVVLWFTLANGKFREMDYSRDRSNITDPGKEKFNDFSVDPDINPEYKTFNVEYTPLVFDRLRELMRFNVLSNIEIVKQEIAKKVKTKNAN